MFWRWSPAWKVNPADKSSRLRPACQRHQTSAFSITKALRTALGSSLTYHEGNGDSLNSHLCHLGKPTSRNGPFVSRRRHREVRKGGPTLPGGEIISATGSIQDFAAPSGRKDQDYTLRTVKYAMTAEAGDVATPHPNHVQIRDTFNRFEYVQCRVPIASDLRFY